jgi:adenylate kinase family enzyme
VIYLDFPIRLCLWRLAKRIVTHRGRARADMPEGCPERFDAAFFWYVMTWNAGPGPRTEAKLASYTGDLVRLNSPRMLAEWRKANRLG